MSQQIAHTRPIEQSDDAQTDQASANIRRRLGNWTTPANGATAPMVSDTAELAVPSAQTASTMPLESGSPSLQDTVQRLRTGMSPEQAVPHQASPSVQTAPASAFVTAPISEPSPPSGLPPLASTVRFIASPSGPLDSTLVGTVPFAENQASGRSHVPDQTAPMSANTQPFVAPSSLQSAPTMPFAQAAPVPAQTVSMQAPALPVDSVRTAPVSDQTVPIKMQTGEFGGHTGAATVPMGMDAETGEFNQPGDYTLALTGGRPTAEFELKQEIQELRRRVNENSDDTDAAFELALALNEADQRTEAQSVLYRLITVFDEQGETEEANRIRAMLGDAPTAAIGTPSDSTQKIFGQTTGTLAKQTGTFSLRAAGNARDGRVAQRGKQEEREQPVFLSREIEFFETLPQLDRLSPEAQVFFQHAESERERARYRSALDSLQLALGTDASVPALFLRMAELQLKLGYKRKALATADDLQRFESLFRSGIPDWVFARLRLHAEPFELAKVQRLVDSLMADDKASVAAPYAARLIEHLERAGLIEEASEYSNKICAMVPGDTRAALEAALLSLKQGNPTAAIERWEFALRNQADLVVARASMAAIIADANEPNHWKMMGEVLPAYRSSHNELIQSAYRRSAEAIGMSPIRKGALSLLFLKGSDPGIRSALAMAAGDRTGSPTGRAAAAAVLARILQTDGRGDEYLAAIRTTLSLLGDERIPAQTNWNGILGFTPSVEEMSYELGEELMKAGDHVGAVEVLKQGYAIDKSHTRLNQSLADALAKTNQLGSALTILDELAMTYRKGGKLDEMAAVLRQMSQLAPANIKVKSRLVDAYLQRGFVAEARAELVQRADLEERAGMTRDAIVSLQRAADLSWNLGFPQESFNLYDRILALDPEDVGNRSGLVNLYLQVGRLSDAAEHQRAVVDLALKNGRKHEAVAALHQVIGLTPDDTTAYYQLGEELASMGEYHQAEKVYRRIVLMCPDDAVALAKATAMAALRERATGN